MKIFKNLFIVVFLLTSLKSYSWNKQGHEIVAQIAKHYLKKSVLDSVQKYLDTLSFEKASTWMDDQRKNHDLDYLKPWHYVNIDRDKTYVTTQEPNLINQLQLAINNVNNRKKLSAADISFNLRVVFHLVGDLHQPLHCGYYEDKGGNQIQLQILNKGGNLHHVWDKSLIEINKIDSDVCISLIDRLSTKKIKAMKKINVLAWVNESRALLPFAYDFNNNQINQEYILAAKQVVTMQLISAGMRLASVLNNAFSK